MEHHLDYPKNSRAGKNSCNPRNGKTAITILLVQGDIEQEIPATGTVPLNHKNKKQLGGFDGRILSLYARDVYPGYSCSF